MTPVAVFGIVLIVAFGGILATRASHGSLILSVAACCVVFAALIPNVTSVLEMIENLCDAANVSSQSLTVVFRGIGICLVTRLSSGICYDMGQKALGETVEYFGQISVLLLALPMVAEFVEQVNETIF